MIVRGPQLGPNKFLCITYFMHSALMHFAVVNCTGEYPVKQLNVIPSQRLQWVLCTTLNAAQNHNVSVSIGAALRWLPAHRLSGRILPGNSETGLALPCPDVVDAGADSITGCQHSKQTPPPFKICCLTLPHPDSRVCGTAVLPYTGNSQLRRQYIGHRTICRYVINSNLHSIYRLSAIQTKLRTKSLLMKNSSQWPYTWLW